MIEAFEGLSALGWGNAILVFLFSIIFVAAFVEVKKIICDYIDPFTGDIWEIGTMPKESQIRLLIQSIRQKAVIRHMTIEASYQDVKGTHEQSLRDLEVSPFMLCKNGEHKIHLVQK